MKRYLWVIEFFIDGEWRAYADAVCDTRVEARLRCAQIFGATRIRKYIPAEKS